MWSDQPWRRYVAFAGVLMLLAAALYWVVSPKSTRAAGQRAPLPAEKSDTQSLGQIKRSGPSSARTRRPVMAARESRAAAGAEAASADDNSVSNQSGVAIYNLNDPADRARFVASARQEGMSDEELKDILSGLGEDSPPEGGQEPFVVNLLDSSEGLPEEFADVQPGSAPPDGQSSSVPTEVGTDSKKVPQDKPSDTPELNSSPGGSELPTRPDPPTPPVRAGRDNLESPPE